MSITAENGIFISKITIEILAEWARNGKQKPCRKKCKHTDGHTEAGYTRMERADVYSRVNSKRGEADKNIKGGEWKHMLSGCRNTWQMWFCLGWRAQKRERPAGMKQPVKVRQHRPGTVIWTYLPKPAIANLFQVEKIVTAQVCRLHEVGWTRWKNRGGAAVRHVRMESAQPVAPSTSLTADQTDVSLRRNLLSSEVVQRMKKNSNSVKMSQ